MRARWLARAVATALAVAAVVSATLVSGADAARADDAPTMQFSADGVNWTTVYSSQLFAGVRLIPGGSVKRTFWVRNDAPEEGQLRVTLAKVSTNDKGLADAMNIGVDASTGSTTKTGTVVPISSAQPCYTLSEGLIVDAQGTTQVDNTMAFNDVNGTVGQNGWVSFVLRVTFSSTEADAPEPNTCPTDPDTETVGGIAEPTLPTLTVTDSSATAAVATAGVATSTSTVYRRTASGWVAEQLKTEAVPATTSTEEQEQPAVPSTSLTVAPNSYRLFQERDVGYWLFMAIVGACVLIVVRRRQHRRDDDEYNVSLAVARHVKRVGGSPNSEIGPSL